jgi:hypothetical protein
LTLAVASRAGHEAVIVANDLYTDFVRSVLARVRHEPAQRATLVTE